MKTKKKKRPSRSRKSKYQALLIESDRVRRSILTFESTNEQNYAREFLIEQMVSVVLLLPNKERKIFIEDMTKMAGHTISIPYPETRTIH